MAALRDTSRRIVHCHGVFDLLHVGHLRYFQEAKAMGDVLVVTLTTDKFVNKGPHRPAFPEQLRAEVLAGLECVDFVAINPHPTAVEAIRLIKPDVYVKGPDYADKAKDVTGKIHEEEAAVQEVGGRIAFTTGEIFSSTALINQHMSTLPPEVQTYLTDFARRHPAREVLDYVERARGLKVLLVGEPIIDEYVYCEAIGKSSKEPTLVVKQLASEKFAGGILAAANHVAGFCDQVAVIAQLGTEGSREAFIESRLKPNVRRTFLHRKNSPTIVKRRFVENYFFLKMLEVYEINDATLSPEEDEQVCQALIEQVPKYDLVIVIDFGHSMLSDRARAIIRERAKFLAVNAQCNAGNLGHHALSKYPHADYVTATEREVRIEARDRHGDIAHLSRAVFAQLGCKMLAVTRGKNGCLCCDGATGFVQVPAVAGKVVDRIGAGDAFLSVSALFAAQGAPMEVVGFAGNAAGALAVATVANRDAIDRVAYLKQVESLLK
ncbi:MAG: PfkB family carbohydrate kinase [Planctomycetaceae bacterium]|jgi:rfaE bifunctional protein nucleotidyltransferase chain/domain|nr:PfkB family carbohydrate kinase [Planctomycetaceae bacterium]